MVKVIEMKLKNLYFLILGAVFMLGSGMASAQTVDSSAYVSIVKKIQQKENVNDGTIRINQSSTIDRMLEQNALSNQRNQVLEGYRIRIYRDNDQNARARSEQIAERFKERYPGVGAYRSYTNPYFMVTVGDFRTVDDATKFQNQLAIDYKGEYSNTYVVKEKIHFPPINSNE